MATGKRLTGSEKVRQLQTMLHAKAKEEPGRRFHALIDKVWREDFLAEAYRGVRRNGGTAGVDGESFAAIRSYGADRWLGELARDLRDGTYVPKPVRQVLIPKKQPGKFRPLGIPCIRDRVAQTSALLALEPIFEADLQLEQYAYRPDRSAHDAVKRVHSLLYKGRNEVVDLDLADYFGQIRHADLMKSLARRFRAEIVNYADDICVLGKAPAADMLMAVRRLMDGLKLPINERKTRCLRCPEDAFEFLGYRIGHNYRPTGGGAYIGTRPSKASVQSICRKISDRTARRYGRLWSEVVVDRLNRALVGWANYFSLGQVSPAYHAVRRLRQWLCRKHKTRSGAFVRFPDTRLYDEYGLTRLSRTTMGLPSAKA